MFWLNIFILSIVFHISNADIIQDEECLQSIKADIVFLLDGTKAIDKFSFEFYVKDYLNDLAKKLSVKSDGALISVILFTDKLHFAVKPEHSVNLPTLLTSIRNMKQPDGDEMKADIIHAISNILNIGFISTNNLDTQNITRIIMLLTDGNIPENYYYPENKKIHNKYILRKSETIIQNLHSRVNYVFSIGIPGANEQGVRRLAKPLQYAFTLTKFGGYKEFDLKHFDPTEVICPIRNYCNEIKRLLALKRPIDKVNGQTLPTNPYYQYPLQRRYFSTTQQRNRYPYSDYEYYYDYGEYPVRRQFQMRSVNLPNYRSKRDDKSNLKLNYLLYLLKTYEAGKKRTGSENIPQTTATTTIEAESTTITASPNYYNSPYYKQPKDKMYKKGQDNPTSVLPSHLKSNVNYEKSDKLSINDSMMVKKSDKNNENRSNCEVRLNKIKSMLLKLLEHSLQQNDSHLSVNENSKRMNNNPTKTLKPVIANYPSKSLQISHRKTFTYNIPISTNEEYKVNKSLINNNNSQTTQQYGDEKYHSAHNTHFLPTDWEDSAMHNGAILMFAIKSHSGIPINQIYFSSRNITNFPNMHTNLNIRTNQRTDYIDNSSRLSSRWYKHDLFDQWYSGSYKYVLLELWSNYNPVVQLKFNARYSDKYTWFSKLFLKSSYPWNEYELMEKSTFLRTSNEPFSILFDPNYINLLSSVDYKIVEKLKGEHINCQHLRGYILIVDSPNSAISQCEWSNATNLKYKTSDP
ncbi:collagen alpha-4(VI) chain-like [Schistosoma japonicum]|uniref:Collagen alpha-4(VI) chain-like n=1 Tax=Schistosoma japonicum TaxID=6182 RepID=A0A4Z2D0W8_SCHJA|nr:collagen alpha-4(VI) chain-like [Schistosoma japonicum]